MPIWGQVELLCRSITEEGRKQSEKLLEQARLQADNTIRDAAQQADRQYQETPAVRQKPGSRRSRTSGGYGRTCRQTARHDVSPARCFRKSWMP